MSKNKEKLAKNGERKKKLATLNAQHSVQKVTADLAPLSVRYAQFVYLPIMCTIWLPTFALLHNLRDRAGTVSPQPLRRPQPFSSPPPLPSPVQSLWLLI